MPRSVRVTYAAMAALAVLVALGLTTPVLGADHKHLLDTVAISLTSAVGIVTCAIRARDRRAHARRSWLILGVAMAFVTLGNMVWSYYDFVRHTPPPVPSLGDLSFFVALALFAVTLFSYPSAPGRQVSRLRLMLDGLIISAALLFVSWIVVLGPVYTAIPGTLVDKIVGLVVPVATTAVGMATFVVVTGNGRRRPLPFLLFGAALFASTITNSTFAVLTIKGTYYAGHPIDIGWVVGFLLFAAAPLADWHRPEAVSDAPERRPVRLVLSHVPLGIAGFVIVARQVQQGGALRSVPFWLGIAILGMVIARQLLTQNENAVLTGELERTVVELRDRERQLAHQASHDPLTNLANRALFHRRVEEAFAAARGTGVALVYVDVDDFKQINDGYGHDVGDAVLRAVAARLGSATRPTDTVARLGGDEFAVVLTGGPDVEDAAAVARRLAAAMADPLDLGGRRLQVGTSIGVALLEPDVQDADDLLRKADVAMYAAKRGGKGTCRFYEYEMAG